jgi:hypothetical protein
LNPQLTTQLESPASSPLQEKRFSTLSLKRLVVLNLATFGLYQFYWLYQNAKTLHERGILKVLPELCLIGILIPALNPFIVFNQFRLNKKLAYSNEIESELSPLAATTILIVSNCMLAINLWQGATHNEPTHHVALLFASMIFYLTLNTGVLWTQQRVLNEA